MKKLFSITLILLMVFSLTACSNTAISNNMYNEISDYVTENIHTLSPESDTEFFDYKTEGLAIGGTYYGYYYSAQNELLLPDFYIGNDYNKIQNDMYEAEGGVFFGKPNNGTDWCFVKNISDCWFYYELHWA